MKNRYLYCIGTLAILSVAACKSKSDKQNAAPPPTSVNVIEAKKADALYYDDYQGTVVALNTTELRSQVAGFITGIFFKEGTVVQKGAPLYEIDRRKYEAAYQQAKANLV
ncbi:MAG TPA: biotin/lipoyl-binding protein, partial [Bacteroidetes bacterium]|nr:biotin/lipoyl-binding protein [Bacteroidota bacterium]